MLTGLFALYAGVAGLMLGSFIGLAADRLPRAESIIRPRSHCRACGRQLTAVDLIPVFGYVLRRGRCASCGAGIGLSSPVVETVSGLLAAVPILVLGVWPGLLASGLLTAIWGSGVVVAGWMRRAPRI